MGQEESVIRSNFDPALKEKYVAMPLAEKRRVYKCGSKYITLDSVPTWAKLLKSDKQKRSKRDDERTSPYRASIKLNEKITIWKGDITKLEIDVIANAANNSLLGGGGVDGAIHAAAGTGLREECAMLAGCDTGEAKITGGYKLPAKYVIHTVGPIGEKETKLRSCYTNCLRLLKENKLRSLAFPCISTGVYGYPNLPAAHVALETTRKWLDTDNNSDLVDRIVFCLFLPTDVRIYEELMYEYFPPGADGEDSDPEAEAESENDKQERTAEVSQDASKERSQDVSKNGNKDTADKDAEKEKVEDTTSKEVEKVEVTTDKETKQETDKLKETDKER